MPSSRYQTSSVYEYLNLLDREEASGDFNKAQVDAIKSSIDKYMLSNRRAQTNAKLLESLLED